MSRILTSAVGAVLATALACGTVAPAVATTVLTASTEATDDVEYSKPELVSFKVPTSVRPNSKFTVTATARGTSSAHMRGISIESPDGGIPGGYTTGRNQPVLTMDYAKNTYTGTWEFYVDDLPYKSYSGFEVTAYDENMAEATFKLPNILVEDPTHPVDNKPVVKGVARIGETLTGSIKSGAGSVTEYKWYGGYPDREGTTLTLNDPNFYGKDVTLGTKTTFPDGTVRYRYSDSVRIELGVPNKPAPKVSGAAYGSTAKADYVHGKDYFLQSGRATTSIQWLLDGKAIAGATDDTYKPKLAGIGKKLQARVTTQVDSYVYDKNPSVKLSTPVTIAKGTFKAPTPKISSPALAGNPTYVLSTLKAKAGTWTPKTALNYQWMRNGKPIKGATKASYATVSADAGTKVTVNVTGKLNGYNTKTMSSAAIKPSLRKLSTPKLYTTGTRKVGYTQKIAYDADLGKWTKGTKVSFQWYRSGKLLKGVTGKSYKLTKADKGKTIEVRATGTKDGYKTATVKHSLKIK
ncbi:hypothetical protein ACNPON_10350 [Glutamicibacter sp. AGC13]